jgi:hypothetical protein
MAFQLSPGVNVSEIDLTTVVPAVGTTQGAFSGAFQWGPIDTRILIDNEVKLVERFGKPDANTATSFFTAANFLAYGNNLRIVRAANTNSNNATTGGNGIYIKNEDEYEENYFNGEGTFGDFAARYAGSLGDSLRISICPSANAFSGNLTSLASITANAAIVGNTVINLSSSGATLIANNDFISVDGGTTYIRVAQVSTTVVTLATALTTAVSAGQSVLRKWQYADSFDGAPGTSTFVADKGGSGDEMHIIVIDEDGQLTGSANTVLEKYAYVSKASDAKSDSGSSSYYPRVLFNRSKYIYWGDHTSGGTNWGNAALGTTYTNLNTPVSSSLSGGLYETPGTDDIIRGYGYFADPEIVDISLVLGGVASQTVATYLISNIAEARKDCLVFLSPRREDVVDQAGSERANITTFRNLLNSSSYAVIDSAWKYQYDKYNDVYRYVPMNGDTAGLCVRTDVERDPWFSPAGFNRGQIKNVIRLSFNPTKAERDELYKIGVNPVVTFPGEGTILFGDKTLLAKPSAFDRINVRRLFIVLEKAIAKAAKFSLFEFNDEFTRAQFVALVEPFLRDVRGRRGIYDYRIVCDETNNTGEVIDRNEFIGDIYIKPARSINFIQLNFVAVRTGVAFDEVVGKF